jgi:hypothetical protein
VEKYRVVKFIVKVKDMLNSVNSQAGSVYVANFVVENAIR